MNKPSRSTGNRLKFVLLITILASFYLIGKLGKYQIVKSSHLKEEALEQWTKSIDLKAKRGIIYDRKGKKLAISINAYTVWATPAEIKNHEETAGILSEILDLDKDEVLEKLYKNRNLEKIKQWISRETANELRKEGLKGISIVEDSKRYYPNENFAAYLLGFTDIDNNGLDGIEKTFNKDLTGISGKWMKMTDSLNRQLPYDGEKVLDPQDGSSLVLSIDETIQYFTEKAAQQALIDNKAKNVSILIMEPKTGDILAMANKPDFDPNNPRIPLDPETQEEWEKLEAKELENKWFDMWRNFSISDIYEPGSTFKLITTAAAIEEGTISVDSHYYCNGFYREIKGEVLKCARWYDPHGSQSLREAVNNSCNIAFINIARQLGKENFLKYVKAFGFGEKTNIDLLGEQAGIIPRSTDVIKEINLATMSYGQGIAVTPIQLLSSVSAIANGGYLMKPRLVREMVDEDGNIISSIEPEVIRTVLSKTTSNTMLSLMETVVSDGTGSRAAVPGYAIGGKTGTALKVVDGAYAQGKYIASFIGVAPIENPQFVILVIVDEPNESIYGGSVSAPIAKEVFEEIFNYLEIQPSKAGEDGEDILEMVKVPEVRKLTLEEAGRTLTSLGFKYTTEYVNIKQGTKIIDQFPLAGAEVKKGSIIDLYIESESINSAKMPFLIGKDKEEVIDILNKIGLNYEVSGQGKAIVQNPLPGDEVGSNSLISVEFR